MRSRRIAESKVAELVLAAENVAYKKGVEVGNKPDPKIPILIAEAEKRGYERGLAEAMPKPEARITVTTTVTNGISRTTWDKQDSVAEALREAYETQGDFYWEEFGVSQADAQAAGWAPAYNSKHYGSFQGIGWVKFLADKGQITRTITETRPTVRELLFG